MRHRAPIALLLAAATFVVFFQVRQHEFVDYDDPTYIVDHPDFHTGPSLEAVIRAFTTPHETNWIPLTWISLQIDYALYGADPAGYHLTNVALHALSSLLLFLALSRMTGARWRSAFVAAVFAVHPLHVESVAWAAERKDALSGLLWMLTLHAYASYAEHPGSRRRYAGVLACLALGLLAKPMLVTLPFVLLLLGASPFGRLTLGALPTAAIGLVPGLRGHLRLSRHDDAVIVLRVLEVALGGDHVAGRERIARK